MSEIGHNKPPSMIETAKEVASQLGGWFAANPVVTTAEEARKIKLHIDRAKLCLKDLEDERKKKVGPLNNEVKEINAAHKGAERPLDAVLDSMLDALDVFVKEEEAKRIKAAEEARAAAEEAKLKAMEAEKLEKEKIDNVSQGELDVNIAEAVAEADKAFDEFVKSERAALRAEEDIHVKIGGGLSRAIGLREREILRVDDAAAALIDMAPRDGNKWLLPETVNLSLLSAARAFRRVFGRLPNGITATVDRNVR